MKEFADSNEWVKRDGGGLVRRTVDSAGMKIRESINPGLGSYHIDQRFPHALRYWSEYGEMLKDNLELVAFMETEKERAGITVAFADQEQGAIRRAFFPDTLDGIEISIAKLDQEYLPAVLRERIDKTAFIRAMYSEHGLEKIILQGAIHDHDPFAQFEDWRISFPGYLNYLRGEEKESLLLEHDILSHLAQKEEIPDDKKYLQEEAATYAWKLTGTMLDELEIDRREATYLLTSVGWFDNLSDVLLNEAINREYTSIKEYLGIHGSDSLLNQEVGLSLWKFSNKEEVDCTHYLELTDFTDTSFHATHVETEKGFSIEGFERQTVWGEGKGTVGEKIPVQEFSFSLELDTTEEVLLFTCENHGELLWTGWVPRTLDVAALIAIARDKNADFREISPFLEIGLKYQY